MVTKARFIVAKHYITKNGIGTRKMYAILNVIPGTYNDLANVATRLKKFSEQAVVTWVHLVGED